MSEQYILVDHSTGRPVEWVGRRYDTDEAAREAAREREAQGIVESVRVERVPADRWSDAEARVLAANARRLFRDHGHGSDMSQLTRMNCGACALSGYEPRGGWNDDWDQPGAYRVHLHGPNYANWQREYVEAGMVVRPEWAALIRSAVAGTDGSDNEPWRICLERSVNTFGIREAS